MKKLQINFTVSAYSVFAGCFLGMQESNAQVIYVDIDPDIILDERLETAQLDMDENGDEDFVFTNSSFTFYTSIFDSYPLRQDLLVRPLTSLNAIAGIDIYHSSSYGGGFSLYYPYALVQQDTINNLLQWQDFVVQLMALRTFCEDGDLCGNAYYCQWYNYGNPGTIDGYLGIRFTDELSKTHYGWIRCDVKDEGRTLVIKDYAYETQPDYPILAGDTTHYVAVQETENTLQATVYSYAKNICIHTAEQNCRLAIYDVRGNKIISEILNSGNTTINMQTYAAGIYIVELHNEESIFRKQILIE